jgi:hypothetical protein
MLAPYFIRDLYYLVYFLLKIIIYFTLKLMLIFLLIKKCIMNNFFHCEKFQFITM